MKKIIFLSMFACMSAFTLSAKETGEEQRAGIHVSGTSYYVLGTSSPEILGNVSVGYNFSSGWGVSTKSRTTYWITSLAKSLSRIRFMHTGLRRSISQNDGN